MLLRHSKRKLHRVTLWHCINLYSSKKSVLAVRWRKKIGRKNRGGKEELNRESVYETGNSLAAQRSGLYALIAGGWDDPWSGSKILQALWPKKKKTERERERETSKTPWRQNQDDLDGETPKGRGYICMCGWFILLYSKHWHNIAKQLTICQ